MREKEKERIRKSDESLGQVPLDQSSKTMLCLSFELVYSLCSVPYRILIKKMMGKAAFAKFFHIAGSLNKTV